MAHVCPTIALLPPARSRVQIIQYRASRDCGTLVHVRKIAALKPLPNHRVCCARPRSAHAARRPVWTSLRLFPSTIASRTRVALPVAALDSTSLLLCDADANLPEMTSNIARLADADGKRCGWCGTSNTSQWRVGTCVSTRFVFRVHTHSLPPLHACLQSYAGAARRVMQCV
eukprot:IDg20146t1